MECRTSFLKNYKIMKCFSLAAFHGLLRYWRTGLISFTYWRHHIDEVGVAIRVAMSTGSVGNHLFSSSNEDSGGHDDDEEPPRGEAISGHLVASRAPQFL